MRILIAEDDHTSRLILQKTLVKLGYDVFATADGEEAWAAFQQERFPVVITDWMMPRADGLELCRRIRADARWNQYTYLVILTMLGGKQSYLEGMEAGADDFITKPFDADELLTRLRVAERVLDLAGAVAYLESLLPTCSECRKIRTTGGEWRALERCLLDGPLPPAPQRRCPECASLRQGTEPRPSSVA